MKKFIFYALLFYAVLFIALYVFTKLHSNENKEAGYIIILTHENITVSDPENGKVILMEKYDSKSPLVKAIIKDNE